MLDSYSVRVTANVTTCYASRQRKDTLRQTKQSGNNIIVTLSANNCHVLSSIV